MNVLPVLYILARTDMDSMNPGKLAAQCSHASNYFIHGVDEYMDKTYSDSEDRIDFMVGIDIWKNSTPQGFGTVLVLGVNYNQMTTACNVADKIGYYSGVVLDPTYPIRDGEVTHFLPVETCGFIFCADKKTDTVLPNIIGNFPLHP